MKGKHTQNCCVYLGLFVFLLPRQVTKIGRPKNCWWASREETQKLKRWQEGFLVIRNILCPPPKHGADMSSSFLLFFFLDVPFQVPCAQGASSTMLPVCNGTHDGHKELRAIWSCVIAVSLLKTG